MQNSSNRKQPVLQLESNSKARCAPLFIDVDVFFVFVVFFVWLLWTIFGTKQLALTDGFDYSIEARINRRSIADLNRDTLKPMEIDN